MKTISMSAGRRQRLAGYIKNDIAEIRRCLENIERDKDAFDDDGDVFTASNLRWLGEVATRLIYNAGQVTGAMEWPDLVDGELANAEGTAAPRATK